MKEVQEQDLKDLVFIAVRYVNAYENSVAHGMKTDAQAHDFYNTAKALIARYS